MDILTVVGSLVLGFLVGALAKRILSAALILAALFIALIAFGYTSPSQVTELLRQLGLSAAEAVKWATTLQGTAPYSSIAFLAGLILGLWKG